ncbi:hypothetical protein DT23_07925 [Thioclava indica]|uniref:Uncharacterized protein n=1 Tax=Thioclava indica TaxID=1353528 RepID=A0A074J6X5_9RHOB|nr:hypothetical protein DT23_07925 [Thioclava indica]
MKQQAKSYFLNKEFAPKLLGAVAATHNTPAWVLRSKSY